MTTNPTRLAWVLAVVAACGGGGDEMADSRVPVPDAPRADAGPPDAGPPGMATVRVYSVDGTATLQADVPVAFVDPYGRATIVATDVAGEATAGVWPGTAVHVQTDPSATVRTALGVDPGMLVVFGDAVPTPSPTSMNGTLTITYPLYGAGAATYSVVVGGDNLTTHGVSRCLEYDGASSPGTLRLTTSGLPGLYGCATTPRSIYILAHSTSGVVIGVFRVPGVEARPGTITASGIWQPPTTYSVSITNLTPLTWWAAAYSVGTYHFHATTPATPQVNGPFLDGDGRFGITLRADPGPSSVAQHVWGPLSSTTIAIDGAAILPFIERTSYAEATRTLSWTYGIPSAVEPDLIRVHAALASPTGGHDWIVYAPGGGTSVVLQPPPVALTGDPGLTPTTTQYIELIDAGTTYADLLTDIESNADNLIAQSAHPLYNLVDDDPYRPAARVMISKSVGAW